MSMMLAFTGGQVEMSRLGMGCTIGLTHKSHLISSEPYYGETGIALPNFSSGTC